TREATSPEALQTCPSQTARSSVRRKTSDDRIEPGRKRACCVKAPSISVHDQQGVLNDVFRLIATPEKLGGKQRRRSNVPSHKYRERFIVAARRRLNEFAIRSGVVRPWRQRHRPQCSGLPGRLFVRLLQRERNTRAGAGQRSFQRLRPTLLRRGERRAGP